MKQRVLPLPEAVRRARYDVTPGQGSCDNVNNRLHVPLEATPAARRIRAHEIAHAKYSPKRPDAPEGIPLVALQRAEDLRMNLYSERAGLADTLAAVLAGDELLDGLLKNRLDVVTAATATVHTGDFEPLLEHVAKRDPELAALARIVAEQAWREMDAIGDPEWDDAVRLAAALHDAAKVPPPPPGEPEPRPDEKDDRYPGEPREPERRPEEGVGGETCETESAGESGEGEGSEGEGSEEGLKSDDDDDEAGSDGGGEDGEGGEDEASGGARGADRDEESAEGDVDADAERDAEDGEDDAEDESDGEDEGDGEDEDGEDESGGDGGSSLLSRGGGHGGDARKPVDLSGDDLTEREPEPEPEAVSEDPAIEEAVREMLDRCGYSSRVKTGSMTIRRVPMPLRLPKGVIGRTKVADTTGQVIGNIGRLATDRAIFVSRGKKVGGGTVAIDCSGSMSLSEAMIEAIIEAAPAATIATYNGAGSRGELRIVAQNGRRARAENLRNPYMGGNIIDEPVVEWLSRQTKPRIWVCDGAVTGRGDAMSSLVAENCARLCREHSILRVRTVEEVATWMKRSLKGRKGVKRRSSR